MTDATPIASFIDADADSQETLTDQEGAPQARHKTVMIEFPPGDPEGLHASRAVYSHAKMKSRSLQLVESQEVDPDRRRSSCLFCFDCDQRDRLSNWKCYYDRRTWLLVSRSSAG